MMFIIKENINKILFFVSNNNEDNNKSYNKRDDMEYRVSENKRDNRDI